MHRFFKKGDHRSIQILLNKVEELDSQFSSELFADDKAFGEYRRKVQEVHLLVQKTFDEFEGHMQSPAMVNAIRTIKATQKHSASRLTSDLLAVVDRIYKHSLALHEALQSIKDIERNIETLWSMRATLQLMHESRDDQAVTSVREGFRTIMRTLAQEAKAEAEGES